MNSILKKKSFFKKSISSIDVRLGKQCVAILQMPFSDELGDK